MPIVRYDSINGISFKSNIINNQNLPFKGVKGLVEMDFSMKELEENVWIPSTNLDEVKLYNGFDFEQIKKDLFGNSRKETNSVGATNGSTTKPPNIMDLSRYGPDWFEATPPKANPKTYNVGTSEELPKAIANAMDGDIIELTSKQYTISSPLKVDKKLTMKSADTINRATISYKGEAGTPAFEMNPKGQLVVNSIQLKGSGDNYAFASLKEDMSSLYNLKILNSEISDFDFVLKAYKYSFSEFIEFKSYRNKRLQEWPGTLQRR